MKKRLFGTDGVRGRANLFPMTPEIALSLGRAVGKILRQNGGKHRVVIGKDTRLSCYMYENALIGGLCSMGVDTLVLGPLPTPGVAFITKAYRADAGIVISASHNPYFDNGIKFFSQDGYKIPDGWEKEMEALVKEGAPAFDPYLPEDCAVGKNTRVDDAAGRYIEFVKGTFPRKMSLKGMKIALDCANGAGYRVAPLIFKELDAEVEVIHNQPDGLNINSNCGALYPEHIQKLVGETSSHIGICLDGDADRVILVDEKGQIVDGDTILAICAKDMMQKGLLQNKTLVATVMSNYGFIQEMESMGIAIVRAKVGDRHVIQEMLRTESNLGGEPSGHIIFLDYNTTGDSLVAALQVLRIMIETNSTLSELSSAAFIRYPQVLVNVKVSSKPDLESIEGLSQAIKSAEKSLGAKGRVLIRYSGTENICRVMVEGAEKPMIENLANKLAVCLKEQIGAK